MRHALRADLQVTYAMTVKQDPIDNSTLHTTCVATRLNAGHANNALPQRAQANVNCRIFPGHSAEDIRQLVESETKPLERLHAFTIRLHYWC